MLTSFTKYHLAVLVECCKYQPEPSARACKSFDQPRLDGPLTKAHLESLLLECGWNKAEVARRVGLSRTAIWKYMKKWNIPLKPEP